MKEMEIKRTLLLLLWAFATVASCQTIKLSGKVTDKETKLPVGGASVSVKDANNTIRYSVAANKEGTFSLTVNLENIAGCHLFVNSLGYQSVSLPIGEKRDFRVALQSAAFQIKEVYVRPKKIVHRNDTTSYLVAGFTTPKDRTIGDVLRNMPGIDVAKNGTVTYNGKSINHFFVDGMDLFDGQYNIATRNISHDVISRVNIIENQQTTKALCGSKEKGETVIDLKLKDKAKGRLTGNVKASAGIPGLWEGELFAANLSATRQTSVTAKTNNSGKDILSENHTMTIEEFINQLSGSELTPTLDISQSMPGLVAEERARQSRTHLVNIGNIHKLSDATTLRTKVYYTDDRNVSRHDESLSYFLADSTLTQSTHAYSILNNRELAASLQLKHNKESLFLTDELKYRSNWQGNRTHTTGDFHNNYTTQSDIHNIENRLEWIKPWGKHYVKLVSYNKFTSLPEHLSFDTTYVWRQDIKRDHFYSSTLLSYTFNLKRWAFAVDLDARLFTMHANSQYINGAKDTTIAGKGNTNYLSLLATPSVTYKYRGLRTELRVPVSGYRYFGSEKTNRNYSNLDFTIEWQPSVQWRVSGMLSAGETAPMLTNTINAPILTDYRTLQTRPANFDGTQSKRAQVKISYADYANMFFANISGGLNADKDHMTVHKEVTDDMVNYTWMAGENETRNTMLTGNLSKRIDAIKGTVNLRCNYTKTDAMMTQNDIATDYTSQVTQVTLDASSNALSWLDASYHFLFTLHTLDIAGMRSTSRSLKQDLQLTFYPTELLQLSIQGEHYLSYTSAGQPKHAFFADILCSYRLRKVDLTLRVTNLLDQRYYYDTSYSDLTRSTDQYRLRPRNIMLGVVTYF